MHRPTPQVLYKTNIIMIKFHGGFSTCHFFFACKVNTISKQLGVYPDPKKLLRLADETFPVQPARTF